MLKYRFLLPLFCVLFVFSLGWLWINQSVRQVTVKRIGHPLSLSRCHHLVNDFIGQGWAFADLAGLQRRLLAEDWVGDVRIVREWPWSWVIHVRQKQVEAYYRHNRYVTKQGKVFYAGALLGQHAKWVEFIGDPQDAKLMLAQLHDVQKICHLPVHLVAVEYRPMVLWRFIFADDMQLIVGLDKVHQNMLHFCDRYPAIKHRVALARHRIDLRYRHGMAIAPL